MALSRYPKTLDVIVLSLEYTHLKAIMIAQYQRFIFVQFLIYAINYHILKENARANKKNITNNSSGTKQRPYKPSNTDISMKTYL